jgi:hypothetical protein
MKEVYYYESGENQRKITACLLVSDRDARLLARGVAICSEKDNFSKKIGRAIAKGRATKALFRGNYGTVRRPEIKQLLPKEFKHKATLRPSQIGVTQREAAIIGAMVMAQEEVA